MGERPSAANLLRWQQLGAVDDRWFGAAGTYDVADGYGLLFGGYVDAATWSFAGGAWHNLTANLAESPPSLAFPLMTYDGAARSVILFGGAFGSGNNSNQTWSFSGGRWTNLTGTTGATPPATSSMVMAYDGIDAQVVLYEGGAAATGQTWVFANGSWTDLTGTLSVAPPTVASPEFAGNGTGSAYLFGGASATAVLSTTWAFAHDRWQSIATGPGHTPPGEFQGAFAAEPGGADFLLFGGGHIYSTRYGPESWPTEFAWQFNGSAWVNVTAALGAGPTARADPVAFSDPALGGIVIASGYDPIWALVYADQWLVTSSGWTEEVSPTAPIRSALPALVYDPADGYDLLFGGSDLNATWTFAGGAWTDRSSTPGPSARDGAAAAFDPAEGYVLLFGGTSSSGAYLNDTWSYSGGRWTNLTAGVGTAPSPRYSAGLAYDPALSSLVLYGGVSRAGLYADTWEFSNGHWTDISTSSGHPTLGMEYYRMTYDSEDGYILLFGGLYSNLTFSNATWSFNGTWRQVPTADAPAPVYALGLTDDLALGAVVEFGGYAALGCPRHCAYTAVGTTWSYAHGQWTNLTSELPGDSQPDYLLAITYDPTLNGTFYFGGANILPTVGWMVLRTAAPTPLSVGTIVASVDPILAGNATQLTVPVSGGLPPYSVSWSGLPANCSSGSTVVEICVPVLAGVYEVSATVTDRAGVTGRAAPFDLSVLPRPEIASVVLTFSRPTLPPGDSERVTAVGLDPAGHEVSAAYTWLIFGPAGTHTNASSGDNVTLTAGSAVGPVNLTAVGSFYGREATGNAQITISGAALAIPSFTAEPGAVSVGGSTVFDLTLAGGASPYLVSYLGLPPGCAAGSALSFGCAPTASGTYTVEAVVNDSAGGSASASVTLTVAPLSPAPHSHSTGSSGPPTWAYAALVGAVAIGALAVALARRGRRNSGRPPPSIR